MEACQARVKSCSLSGKGDLLIKPLWPDTIKLSINNPSSMCDKNRITAISHSPLRIPISNSVATKAVLPFDAVLAIPFSNLIETICTCGKSQIIRNRGVELVRTCIKQ